MVVCNLVLIFTYLNCRCFLGANSGPAQKPSSSRVVEALCLQLCRRHPSPRKKEGTYTPRFAVVLQEYINIRDLVLSSADLLSRTTIQLFEINQHTLSQWYVDFVHYLVYLFLSFQSCNNIRLHRLHAKKTVIIPIQSSQ